LTLAAPIDRALRALAAFSGATQENMTRNFAWRFLELGRRIERGTQTIRMLQTLVAEPREDEGAGLFAILRLCDSFFAYRARYLTTPETASVLDLLAMDETNPRSLAYQFAAMETAISELPATSHVRTPEHKTVLALLTNLRIQDAPELAARDEQGNLTVLQDALTKAEAGMETVSDRLAASYFSHAEAAPTQIMLVRQPLDEAQGDEGAGP
jgi:uncharacterized alpha-E superfamily protein